MLGVDRVIYLSKVRVRSESLLLLTNDMTFLSTCCSVRLSSQSRACIIIHQRVQSQGIDPNEWGAFQQPATFQSIH